jgi:hypothetical protein
MQAIFQFGLNSLCDGHVIIIDSQIQRKLIISPLVCDSIVIFPQIQTECDSYIYWKLYI